ncbi:MAG: alpha-L-fucosidase [Caldilineaceae bacterium]
MTYQPTYESVSQHPVPAWFHNAKLGIFVHWGLYSVPAFAPPGAELGETLHSGGWAAWFARNPYAEWYMNSYQIAGSPSQQFHASEYGADFDYAQFAPLFNQAVEKWNPSEWAALFKQVNARYVVLTTKHHDGFLLWPSRHPNPFKPNYHAARDLVGELTDAVRAQGLTMALYYSGGLDWTFNPKVIQDIADIQGGVPQMEQYVQYANAHWRELIERYQTRILWNDIAYPAHTNLNALFADYYNQFPDGLVNNRFTQKFEMRESGIVSDNHHDFETPEYATFAEIRAKKWESCRGIGASFGYNHAEGPEHYQSGETLVRMLVDIVSKNGNLLLNIGPRADGTIPDMQRERLLALGRWLDANGEAIFDTRPWHTAEGVAVTPNGQSIDVRFTQTADALYATLLDTPQATEFRLQNLHLAPGATVQLLNGQRPLSWSSGAQGTICGLDAPMPDAPAHAIKISPLAAVGEDDKVTG